jgi:hypothetical protein
MSSSSSSSGFSYGPAYSRGGGSSLLPPFDSPQQSPNNGPDKYPFGQTTGIRDEVKNAPGDCFCVFYGLVSGRWGPVSGSQEGGGVGNGLVAANTNAGSGGELKSFADIAENPELLYGKSADEVAKILGEGWTKGNYGKTGTGWAFRKGDKMVFYHKGGRHVGVYYGYSSGPAGTVKVVGPGYVAQAGDKATLLLAPDEGGRLSQLLRGGKSILGRLGPILEIGSKVALPIALTYEAIDVFMKEVKQQKALDIIEKSFKEILEQADVIEKRISEGKLCKEDVEALRIELENMRVLMLVFKEQLNGMSRAAPSDAIRVGLADDAGGKLYRRLFRIDLRLVRLLKELEAGK